MYAAFFGLREQPFNNTPDPRFFFLTPDHEEALASITYAVQERKGFVLLTGEVGAGKTLISRMMLRHFGTQIVYANVHHAVNSADELMESVCQEFELVLPSRVTRTQRVKHLHDFLLRQFGQNVPAVLVLDEAQNLPIDAFEQLRMIGNLESDDAKLLQVVIVGQPELRVVLASKELRQLSQRIFRGFHLPSMNRETTEAYIHHRLSVAGASQPDLFDAAALELIHSHSRGLPRIVNALCDNALLSAYAADRRKVDGEIVRGVIQQMMFEAPAGMEIGPTINSGRVCETKSTNLANKLETDVLRPSALEAAHKSLFQRATELSAQVGSVRRPTPAFLEPDLNLRNWGSKPNKLETKLTDAQRRLDRLCRRFMVSAPV